MKNLQIFSNPDFGEVRMVEIDGKPYAVGVDVARALGYARPENAIAAHCRCTRKQGIPHPQSANKKIMVNVIPEGDLYRLIVHSQLPAAEKFERWVFDEVLPTIRKTGRYEAATVKRTLGEVNSAARIITQTLKEAGMAPQFRAVALKSLYEPVGVEIPLDGITVQKHLFDATAIAKQLGICSKSGNPHAQAISAIISKLSLEEGEREVVPFQNQASGHSGTNWQYSKSVIAKIAFWLRDNGYPEEIAANGKSYKVTYVYNHQRTA